MNLELTAEQAQTVINSQKAKLDALRLRMKRAHVTMKYLVRASGLLTPEMLEEAVAELRYRIEKDEFFELNHSEIELVIEQYEALKLDPKWTKRGIKVPQHQFLWQFAVNGHDDVGARNVVYEVKELMSKYLWREGEELTPEHFSSHELSME